MNAAGAGASAGDIADAVLDELIAEHTDEGSLSQYVADILEDTGTTLDDKIDTISGGGGSYECVLTIRTTGGSAIAGAKVWLSTDSSGSPTYGSAQYANASGQVTFWLDNDDYYVFASGAGYNYSNDESFTVEDEGVTQNFDYGTQLTGNSSLTDDLTGGFDAFLIRMVNRIRLLTDEPSIHKKYSDTKMILLIEDAFAEILQDLQRSSTTEITSEVELTYDDDIEYYTLPPTCGKIISMGLRDSTTGIYSAFFEPRSHLNAWGPGVQIEGNVIRIQPNYVTDGETITVKYKPNGCVKLFKATTDAVAASTIKATTVDLGFFDTRPNAYLGCMLRILDSAYAQERIITGVSSTTLTVKPAFSPTLAGSEEFEITPNIPLNMDHVVAAKVALAIVSGEGNETREKTLARVYSSAMRSCRLAAANKDFTGGQSARKGGYQGRSSNKRKPRL